MLRPWLLLLMDPAACPTTPARCVGESELEAAARLQRALLPPPAVARGGWSAAYRYSPAGAVGGDVVDLIPSGDHTYFVLADVSGKGVAASILTGYIHAIFRSLVPLGMSVDEIVRRASALLCASTLPAQYATLVFGYLAPDGEVVLANAGHPEPIVAGARHQAALLPTGAAAGLFCDSTFGTAHVHLDEGETLVLYTDGLTEAFDAREQEYGTDRLQLAINAAAELRPRALLSAIAEDQARFLGGVPPQDDMAILALRRDGQR